MILYYLIKKYADQIKKEETLDVSPQNDPNTKNGQLHFRIRYRYKKKI